MVVLVGSGMLSERSEPASDPQRKCDRGDEEEDEGAGIEIGRDCDRAMVTDEPVNVIVR